MRIRAWSRHSPRVAGELSGLHAQLGFSADEIRALILQAARDSWLPQDRKQRLVESLEADPAWSGEP